MNSDIYCISDLHIGNKGCRDNFHCNNLEGPFLSFVNYVRSQGAELMILGDLFDFWLNSVGDVISKNLNIINQLAQVKSTYIIGNHDVDIRQLIETKMLNHSFFENGMVEERKNINGIEILFKHGHDVDPANCGVEPGKGRLWTIFAAMVKDQVANNPELSTAQVEKILLLIPEVLSEIKEYFDPSNVEFMESNEMLLKSDRGGLVKGVNLQKRPSLIEILGNLKEIAPYAGSIYEAIKKVTSSSGIDIDEIVDLLEEQRKDSGEEYKLLVGHTHKAGFRGNWYYNTGYWSDRGMNVTKIDTVGEISLLNWDGGSLSINKSAHEI